MLCKGMWYGWTQCVIINIADAYNECQTTCWYNYDARDKYEPDPLLILESANQAQAKQSHKQIIMPWIYCDDNYEQWWVVIIMNW